MIPCHCTICQSDDPRPAITTPRCTLCGLTYRSGELPIAYATFLAHLDCYDPRPPVFISEADFNELEF